MAYTLPPDNRSSGQSGHIADHNDIVDVLIGNNAALNVQNTIFSGGADPTGVTDSTAAIQGALNTALPGQLAYMPPGQYMTSSPLVIPPFVGLAGSPSTSSIAAAGTGSVLVPSSGFTAGSWPTAAVILIVSQDVGSYSVPSQEQHVQNLMIQGSGLLSTSNVAGIAVWSGSDSVGQVNFQNVLINATTGWGYATPNNAVGQTRAFNVLLRGCGTNHSLNAGGFQLQCSDSNFLFCESNSNWGDAWNITDSYDSVFNHCHGEHSGNGYGFNYTANYNNSSPDAGGITFMGCSVDAGVWHGFFLQSSGSHLPPVNIIGAYVRRNGTASTSAGYAGYCIDAYFGPVNLVGCQVYPGLPDGGGGSNTPQYAISAVSNGSASTSITVSGGIYIGASQGINVDGSQQVMTVSGDTTFGSGQGTSTVTYTPGVMLQATGSELLPVDRVLAVQPAGCLATSLERGSVTGSLSPSTGIPYWHLVNLVAGVPVTNVNTWVTASAKTGGSHGWVAIVSVSTGKVVAVSADQTDASTTWGTSNASQVIALSPAYTPPLTGAYWLVVSITASSMPTLGSVTTSPVTSIATTSPIYCGSSSSQTTPPAVAASLSPTAAVGDHFYIWAS